MDKLSFMKAFCRIIERGSFARAAEDLGVSTGLLSRDLKLLEESLGCTLLTRTTRVMSLTEHGRVYYKDARRILEDIDLAEEQIRASAGAVRGTLRVNAPYSFGTTVLSPLLIGFMDRFPELQLSLSLDDHVVDLIERGFDLSIRVRPHLPDSGLIARKIAPVRQRLFAAPSYLEDQGAPSLPKDLREHALIAFSLADDPGIWTLTGPGGTEAISLAPRIRLGSSLILRDMLVGGQGIGSLPDFLSDPMERMGQLKRVLPEWELPQRYVYAVTGSRLGADAKTLAFINYLSGALRQPR